MILVSDQKVDKVKEAVMVINLRKASRERKQAQNGVYCFQKALSPRGVHEE